MQMRLPRPPRIPNPLLQYPLRLLHKLPVQINRIPIHPAHGIVLPKDVLRSLPVVRVHHGAMPLALFRQLVRRGPVTAFVGLVGLFLTRILLSASLFGICVFVVVGERGWGGRATQFERSAEAFL